MSAILEIPEVRQRFSKLTIEEYHRLDEFNGNRRRTELIRGVVLEKIKKSALHVAIASRLYSRLRDQAPIGFLVWKDDPLTFADSEPEPDLYIVRGSKDDFRTAHSSTAELIIEVAVSSPALDRENASLYAEAGVKEYWIVLATQRQIEVYRRSQAGHYQEVRTVGLNETVECVSVAGLRIRVSELFV
jgi:Uma2 family endonuclease